MKQKMTKDTISTVVISILLLVLGLVLLINPDFGSAALTKVLGWALIVGGVLGILAGIFTWPAFGVSAMALCAVALAAGIYLLNHAMALAALAGLVLGVYIILRGIIGLRMAFRIRADGLDFKAPLVYALILIVLGLALVCSPLSPTRLIMRLSGVAMIVCAALNLLSQRKNARYIQRSTDGPDIIDADD
ncbi:MAG: DUF308 domain-containing protein [Faecousia sp.]